MTQPLQSWVQNQQGKFLLRRGANLMRQGNLAEAIAIFSAALTKHPYPEEIYLKRGIAYFKQEAFPLALSDFDAAIALTPPPHSAQLYSYRGLARYQMDDVDGAMADWATALQHQPNDDVVRYNRGLVYIQQAQYEAALQDFDIAIEQNPLVAEAYLHRGRVKQYLGDFEGAVKDWEVALCNDLGLDEAQQMLSQVRQSHQNQALQEKFADLLPAGFTLSVEQQDALLILSLHRVVGTPINYFQLPNTFRDRLVELELPNIRRFRLIAKGGDSSLSEWDQTYGIYDKAPCPPARWRAALITTLLLFPPFGVVALVLASQVKPAYKRGDYPIAAGASQAVKKLFLSSSAIMGLMLFGVASYGVYTYVEGEYPNPAAKTAFQPKAESVDENSKEPL